MFNPASSASARRPRSLRAFALWGAWAIAAAAALLAGCAGGAPASVPMAATPPVVEPAPAAPAASVASAALADVRTRHALFRASRFAELPGWASDDLMTGWDAFGASCKALAQRDAWKPVCASASKVVPSTPEIRRFFETQFALFRLLNADASTEGDVTGYYEPLIAGSLRSEGVHTVPVYGVPNDLFTLDWKSIPSAQRSATVQVVARGRELVVLPVRQPGSYALDTTQFEFDARDRRWRVRLDNGRALPYRTRAEIEAQGRIDAPVLAWVDDALALYAMQVQGSGRIRLSDGTVLRLQYAEQNGHPFRPVRLASKTPERPVTRGAPVAEEPERFALAQDDTGDNAAALVTRGVKPLPAAPAAKPKTEARSGDLVEQLLRDAQAGKAAPPARTPAKPRAASNIPGAPRTTALDSDPSYVFFRVASDQRPGSGPAGALGVPLTPGRSIAVDPRVTPMGYPVYLSAPTPPGSTLALQRLVMAQDTGGAIRGAIRADFFWGYGTAAGHLAMRTRERVQLWLMLPHAEAARLQGSGLVTRGARAAPIVTAQCLIADETFCSEPD